MDIKFINHSSIIINTKNVCIISDPWLFGEVFNDGWSLLCNSPEVDWNKITHVWISHEHPDHFHIPSLISIPVTRRSKITVLYQETKDKKVISWFRKNGFIVKELPLLKKIELAPSLFIKTGSTPQDDSWLLLDDGKVRFLNMNDCETKSIEHGFIMRNFAKKIGKIDVLASQFSFASYLGGNLETRKQAARTVIDKVSYQLELLKPTYFIPFASFFYFSHPENFDQNEGNNTVLDIVNVINSRKLAVPVVLYPGDIWRVGKNFSNHENLNKYKKKYKLALAKPLKDKTKIFLIDSLKQKGNIYKEKLIKKNPLLNLLNLDPALIWVNDLNLAIKFDITNGLQEAHIKINECDMFASSDLIATWFDYDYGGASLYISGRMGYDNIKKYRKTYKYFFISNGNNRGEQWPWFSIKRRINVRLLKIFR